MWNRRRRRVQSLTELDQDILDHIQHEIEENLARGMAPEEARRAALRAFGNVTLFKEETRLVWIASWWEQLLQDVWYAARTLRKNPGFTSVAVLTLALGIATNSAMFSVVNTVLLKRLAYAEPDRIVMFQKTFPQGRIAGTSSPSEFFWWRQQTSVFQNVSAYSLFDVASFTDNEFPEQLREMRLSADFFGLCGTNPILGRAFGPEDDRVNAPKTVVLAYAFWQRRFGGDPRIIGRRITLNGERHEIIGVAGANLNTGQVAEMMLGTGDITILEPPDVYVPFQLDPNSPEHVHYFNVVGRLNPGVTLTEANAELQASYLAYGRKWPDDFSEGGGFRVEPLQDAIVGGVRHSLLILLGAVSLVLLIACANVANLLLARATSRKREIAIRLAIGAGRARILRQLVTESVMLSFAGGVLGLGMGYAAIRALLSLSPGDIPRIGPAGANVELDWRVLAFTLIVSIITGILFGLIPALQSSRAALSGAIKESNKRNGTGFRGNRAQALLVTTQVGLAVVLLIGSALLIRTFIAIRQVNPGFDPHGVLTMHVLLKGPQFENPARVTSIIRDGLHRIRALPGVAAAAATDAPLPLEAPGYGIFQIPGRLEGPTTWGVAVGTSVSAGYFETLKIPILRGRSFTEQDESGPPVVIINETLAKQFWPDGDPLKDQLIKGCGTAPYFANQPPLQIIGIVGDVHVRTMSSASLPTIYVPSAMGSGEWAWVIRTQAKPTPVSSAIQEVLRQASGGEPVARVRTMDEIVSQSTAAEDFNALVLTIFGFSALLLASIGIYGLMAYSVTQRAQEIGIRMALGAGSSQIRKMVVFQGLRPAITGVVVGLAASFALTRLIVGLLFGVTPLDLLAFSTVPIILLAVALIAVWLPATRAGRVDPALALRQD